MSVFRGIRFFLGNLPSFTRIGYQYRARRWRVSSGEFHNQTWVVTGASGGIGAAIAEIAAIRGARVIALGRTQSKLDALKLRVESRQQMLAERNNHGHIIPMTIDLSQMKQISKAIERLSDKVKIDVLVNNVGILNEKYIETPEEFEQSYAVNLLGQYYLTEGLLKNDAFAKYPLIIAMASGGLYHQPLNLGLLNQKPEKFDGAMAYASHKRAQIALVDHWRRAYRDKNIFTYVMHPGWVGTYGVDKSMPFFSAVLGPILRTPRQGADTAIWLAVKRPRTRENIVWFDRKQRTAHKFKFTRHPKTTLNDLRAMLNEHINYALRKD